MNKADMDMGRIVYYAFFSKIFVFTYDEDRFCNLLDICKVLQDCALDDSSENSLKNLVKEFENNGYEGLKKEYEELFNALKNQVRNTISYYDEGYETSLAHFNVRQILAKTEFRKDESKFKENEDSFGFVFTMMSIMLKDYESLCKELFVEFLNPYVDDFMLAIKNHPKSKIFLDITNIMESFFEFERVYYGCKKQVKDSNKKITDISRSEMLRRESNKKRKEESARK